MKIPIKLQTRSWNEGVYVATVTGYTAPRMKEIEDSAIVSGIVVGDDLMLTRFDGEVINAGNVRGIQGPPGSSGDTAILIVTSTTRPSAPFDGSFIYETDTKRLYSWDGSAWVYKGGTIICTTTTIPTDLFPGLSIYVTDTQRSYIWSGSYWIYTSGLFECTSLTRPTVNLFDGFQIYELDTKKILTWNGAAWTLPKNQAGGVLDYRQVTSPQIGIPVGGADLLGLSVTVNVPASRYIKVTGNAIFQFVSTATDAIGTINEGATELQRFAQVSSSLNQNMGSVILTPSAGFHTYKLRARGVTNSIDMQAGASYPAFILVEDIGGF